MYCNIKTVLYGYNFKWLELDWVDDVLEVLSSGEGRYVPVE